MKLFMHELGYLECNKNAGDTKVDVQFWRVAKGVIEITEGISVVWALYRGLEVSILS